MLSMYLHGKEVKKLEGQPGTKVRRRPFCWLFGKGEDEVIYHRHGSDFTGNWYVKVTIDRARNEATLADQFYSDSVISEKTIRPSYEESLKEAKQVLADLEKSKKLKINKMTKPTKKVTIQSLVTVPLSWEPVRSGNKYCSPACGAGCTHKSYVKAFGLAEDLAKKCSDEIGGVWKARVWENLGWHWEVVQKGSNVAISYGGYLAKGTGYSVGFLGGTPAQVAVRGSFDTPKEAYDALGTAVADEAKLWNDKLNSMLENSKR